MSPGPVRSTCGAVHASVNKPPR
jgi:predicted ester cyclase